MNRDARAAPQPDDLEPVRQLVRALAALELEVAAVNRYSSIVALEELHRLDQWMVLLRPQYAEALRILAKPRPVAGPAIALPILASREAADVVTDTLEIRERWNQVTAQIAAARSEALALLSVMLGLVSLVLGVISLL